MGFFYQMKIKKEFKRFYMELILIITDDALKTEQLLPEQPCWRLGQKETSKNSLPLLMFPVLQERLTQNLHPGHIQVQGNLQTKISPQLDHPQKTPQIPTRKVEQHPQSAPPNRVDIFFSQVEERQKPEEIVEVLDRLFCAGGAWRPPKKRRRRLKPPFLMGVEAWLVGISIYHIYNV